MALPVLLVTTASLLTLMVVMAQRDVVITVSSDGGSYLYHIGFSISLFTEFHECLSKGAIDCVADYEPRYCPNCTIETIIPSDQGNQELQDNFYKCTNSLSTTTLNCHKQTQKAATRTESYLLRNSSHPSTCFGFVWTLDSENITFNSNNWDVEYCGANCACPSRSTTAQSETTTTKTTTTKTTTTTTTSTTTTFSSPSLVESVSPTRLTSSPSSLSTPSAATQEKSSTKTPTERTTAGSTTNSSSPSTESSSSTDNSGDDPPIAVIVGAVLGVIAVIVIIIIIAVIWRKRTVGAKSSDHAKDNGAKVKGNRNNRKSHSSHDTEFSESSSESHTPSNGVIRANGYQNSLHQPNIIKNGVTPSKDAPKPQFAIKDNDSDFGYSTAQLVVPEDNNRNVNGKKLLDDYDYVYAEDDVGVSDPNPQAIMDKTPAVSPPKVRDDYAVVDKTRKNKMPGNIATNNGLSSDYDDIPEEDYGYSHAEGDPSAQGTNDVAVGKALVTVPKGSLAATSDLNQDYEYLRASDGYTTVGNVNQSNPNNDDPNTTGVYSRLHEPVRDIQNPYNVGPNTGDVYPKLHEEVRDIKNPYNVLPEAQGTSDSHNALPDTVHNAQDTKKQKLSKGLPYGPQDYAVVVKTKSNKPAQSTFELENDDN